MRDTDRKRDEILQRVMEAVLDVEGGNRSRAALNVQLRFTRHQQR